MYDYILACYTMTIVFRHLRKSKLFFTMNFPVLSVQVHPLGKTEIEDHTTESLWLGPSFPLNLSVLSRYRQQVLLAKHTYRRGSPIGDEPSP